MLNLKAEKRDVKVDVSDLRKQGFVPGVFYGPKETSTPIFIKESEFIKAYATAGESTVVVLNDGSEDHETLIHEVQFNAVSGKPEHVDFYVIEKGKKVRVNVPLNFEGVSPAEKNLGGVLIKVMHEVEIEAMPKDLPHELLVDISSLENLDSQIHTKDIKLPNGVELITDQDEVVILVQEAKEENLDEAPVEVDMASVEVEKKGKEEEPAPAE